MARLKIEVECIMRVWTEVTLPDVDVEAPVDWADLPDVYEAVKNRRLPAGVWQHRSRDRRIVRIDRVT